MNGEDRQSEAGSGAQSDDNVVRLTDWLGPREELVPFGPRAEAAERADAGSPPAACDFWGENSGAVQDALTALHPDHARIRTGSPSIPVSGAHRSRTSAAALWSRRRAAIPAARQAIVVHRGWPAAAASLLAMGLLAGILAVATESGIHPRPRLSAQAIGARDAAGVRKLAPAVRAPEHRLHSAAHIANPRAGAHRTLGRSSQGRGARSRHRERSAAAPAQPVGYTTPTSASTYSTPTQAPTSTRTATTAPPTTPTGQSAASGSQPALGANGALAPGASPDG